MTKRRNRRIAGIFAMIGFLSIMTVLGKDTDVTLSRRAVSKILSVAAEKELTLKYRFPDEATAPAEALLWDPSDIESDQDNIYVADVRRHCIIKYDKRGAFLSVIGRRGQGPGEYNLPASLIVARKCIVIHDMGNSRVQVVGKNGEYESSFKLFRPITSFVTQDGKVLYASCFVSPAPGTDAKLVNVLSNDGFLLRSFAEPLSYPKDQNILNLATLGLDEDGNVILAFEYVPIVRIYSPEGKLLAEKTIADRMIDRYKSQNDKRSGIGRYFAIFSDLKVIGNKIYVMFPPDANLMKILELDRGLNVVCTYCFDFAKINRKNWVRRFTAVEDHSLLTFLVLFHSNEEKQVYAFGVDK